MSQLNVLGYTVEIADRESGFIRRGGCELDLETCAQGVERVSGRLDF